jgi:hypothetical protein
MQVWGIFAQSSSQRRERLDKFVEGQPDPVRPQQKLRKQGLLTIGGVRWNAVLRIIERGLAIKPYATAWMRSEINAGEMPEAYFITPPEWDELKAFQNLLHPLMALTKRVEGNAEHGHHGSLWEVITGMQHLFDHFDEIKDTTDKDSVIYRGQYTDPASQSRLNWLFLAADRGIQKLTTYWGYTEASPAYLAAVVFHPRFKWAWAERKWRHDKKWIIDGKRETLSLWQSFYAKHQARQLGE